MTNRISITNGEDFDNSSDPAASVSSGSQQNPAATPESSIRQSERSVGNDPAGGSSERNTHNTTTSAASAYRPSEEELATMRVIMPGAPEEELIEIIRENNRASNNNRHSANDARMAAAMTSQAASPSSPSAGRLSGNSHSGSSRRSWAPCQPAPSRPGVYSVGGRIESGRTFNIGETNPLELEIKRIEAVSQVQEALTRKLGYNLRDSGKYEEMEREYAEGERILASTGLERREKKVLPTMMVWDALPMSRSSMMKKEPAMPKLGEPIPLPLSFGGHGEGMQNGGNGEICVGKFVDTAPDEEDDEQKREEDLDSEAWAGVSVDDSPMGPYDQVVRCWKCRAGLKVHIEVGLVACPRCRTISPATDVANIG